MAGAGRQLSVACWIALPVALCGLSAGLVAWEVAVRPVPAVDPRLRIQTLVGGHGMGAVTIPAWCYFSFDPRTAPLCTCHFWPLPGGYCFCPDHTATVTHLVEDHAAVRLPRLSPRRGSERVHAIPP